MSGVDGTVLAMLSESVVPATGRCVGVGRFDRLEEEDLEPGSPVRPIVDTIRTMHEDDREEIRIEYSTVFQALTDDAHRGFTGMNRLVFFQPSFGFEALQQV